MPREVKVVRVSTRCGWSWATAPCSGLPGAASWTLTGPSATALTSRSPSTRAMITAGIRSLPAISPRWSPSAAKIVPTAPAAAAWSAREAEPQARSGSLVCQASTATLPLSRAASAGSKAVQPSGWSTGSASSPPTSLVDQPWYLALQCAGTSPASGAGPSTRTPSASPCPSTEAATAMARGAVPGLPPTPYTSPSLPSERLTTSRWSEGSPLPLGLAARSRAWASWSVEPSQPNTRIAYSWAPGAAPGPTLKPAGSRPGWYGPV